MAESEHGQDDQELVFKETVEDLRSLIIYAKATSIKPWSWERQKATNVTQIFSFGEPTAIELCTSWNKGVPLVFFLSFMIISGRVSFQPYNQMH